MPSFPLFARQEEAPLTNLRLRKSESFPFAPFQQWTLANYAQDIPFRGRASALCVLDERFSGHPSTKNVSTPQKPRPT